MHLGSLCGKSFSRILLSFTQIRHHVIKVIFFYHPEHHRISKGSYKRSITRSFHHWLVRFCGLFLLSLLSLFILCFPELFHSYSQFHSAMTFHQICQNIFHKMSLEIIHSAFLRGRIKSSGYCFL